MPRASRFDTRVARIAQQSRNGKEKKEKPRRGINRSMTIRAEHCGDPQFGSNPCVEPTDFRVSR